ncbi:hypothetical protein MVES1_000269 [Malassezia vespertilionis]|uniref:uncharacterized protein n=1 Tax=Malassezia vespertilionis TaxID=2020962 RepID=UPI0024B24939|nr:uncharacterized protein MVES1_000269 [Malassezia vespertilionis]WFD04944.1 hypothetical protein MVES1_000269 [Malassezia vespertilionis]
MLASAAFPENTLASFEQAIRDGSEGIESDIHLTKDDVIVMFHDTTLDRTTDGKGKIGERPYYGMNGIEHVRTIEEPVQQIPTFEQLCALLMKPENQHVKLNIDCKPNNDPERMFSLMHDIVAKFSDYKTNLAPRLVLGLWHPKFILPAKKYVPSLRRAHIGASPAYALKYFWDECDAFSIYFPSLVSSEGQQFLQRAKQDGKDVMTWTVNRIDEMVQATSFGVKAILTDHTADLQSLRREMRDDFAATKKKYVSPWFVWASYRYYQPSVALYKYICGAEVERSAGMTFRDAAQA